MDEKNYYLVKHEANYSDEFDISGFFVSRLTNKELREAQSCLKNEEGAEMHFGSNEFVELIPESVTFTKITDKEYKFLEKCFNLYGDHDYEHVSHGIVPSMIEKIVRKVEEANQ